MVHGQHHGRAYTTGRWTAVGSEAGAGTALLTAAETGTMPRSTPTARAVLGLDTGVEDLRAADAVLHALVGLPADTTGCTHLIRGEYPHVAMSLDVPAGDAAAVWDLLRSIVGGAPGRGAAWGYRRRGAAPAAEAAAAAAAVHTLGSGRAVFFPGAARLTGTVTVDELLAGSAILRVAVLGGGTAGGSDEIVTRGHVRPQRCDGELVLTVIPTEDGRLAPLECPDSAPFRAEG